MQPGKILPLGLALAVLIAGSTLPAVGGTAVPVRRVNAHELVRIAAGSCTAAARALDKRADSQDPRYQPLRSVLKSMAGSVSEVGARLDARDLGFFKALRTGSRTLAEMHVLLTRTQLQDPEIAGSIGRLDAAYGRLRNRYGQEWLRFRTGKQLNEEEERRFEALRAMQALLAVRLQWLQEKAWAAGDGATAGELGRLAARAKSIARAPSNLDELLNASVASDTIQGEYAALREANPVDDPEWSDADQIMTDLSTDESVGFVFTTDLQTVQQWSYTGERTALPDAEEVDKAAEEAEAAEVGPEAGEADDLAAVEPSFVLEDAEPETAAVEVPRIPEPVPAPRATPRMRCFLL